MIAWVLLTNAWSLEPSVLLGCALLLGGYLRLARRELRRGQTALFSAGVGVLVLALVSPIDVLGDEYLFSAHMLQHLLLVLVVPPLILMGLPAESVRRALRLRLVSGAASLLGHPPVAWLLAAGALWVWHLPALYNAALADEWVHVVQHLTFLVTATAFWWAVLSPLEERRLGPGTAMLYLFTAGMASSILGIILTFAPAGLYPLYLHPEDELGLLPLIRNEWGLSAAADQQLGGLLMWVPGGLVYLLAIFVVFARWQMAGSEDVAGEHAIPDGSESALAEHGQPASAALAPQLHRRT